MKRAIVIIGAVLVPFAVFALDFTDSSVRYKDEAQFSTADRAGINVLTNIGAVSGNPDGRFYARRSVNRAEFMKILFLSNPMEIGGQVSGQPNCFPDVHASDWFSRFVCLAKDRGIIAGYPDGMFHPEQTVNYAEALKILVNAYSSSPVTFQTTPWYQVYVNASNTKGTSLTESVPYDTPLTRGQVARLAAAFRAKNENQLAQYRMTERGEAISSEEGSSSSSESSASSFSSITSISSASSVPSSSISSTSLFPSQSHFLLVGQESKPLFDGTFTSVDEDSAIRFVDVTLFREVHAVSALYLVDAQGKHIAELRLSTDNNTDHLKWKATVSSEQAYVLQKNVPTSLGIVALLKAKASGGVSNEIFEVKDFSITVHGTTSGNSKNIPPTNFHRPQHQTTDARITEIRKVDPESTVITSGLNKLLGSFAVSGETMAGGILNLESVAFDLQSTGVSVTNLRIGGKNPVEQMGCGADDSLSNHYSCDVLPETFRTIGTSPLVFSIYGNVAFKSTATTGTVRIVLPATGTLGKSGSIHWGDSLGHYNWIENDVPLESGTVFTVQP